MARFIPVAAVLLVALVAVPGAPAVPLVALAAPALISPRPAAGALVDAGLVEIAVTAEGGAAITAAALRVDGVAVEHTVDVGRPGRLRAEVRLAAGSHVAEASVTDDAGHTAQRSWRFEVSGVTTRRVAGPDRLATAVALSAAQFPAAGSAAAVVLARADDFADALGGAPLAVRLDGPLLLTPSDLLPDVVRDELRRVLAPDGTVVVLGGTAAVGAEVEAQVAALGLRVRRLAGDDRAATAAGMADALWAETVTGRTAVLVSGEAFPDALSASVPAAIGGWPILLTGRDELPADTAAALDGVERLVVVGGEAAVSPAVVDQARASSPGLRDSSAVERLAGPTRFDTAAAVAATLPASATATLAGATSFPDALAGAPLAARLGSPLLLVGVPLPPATVAALTATGPAGTAALVVLGGTATVGDDLAAAAWRTVTDGGPPPVLDPATGSTLATLEVGTTFRIASDLTVDAAASQAQLEVDGAEVPLALRAEGTVLLAEVTAPPAAPDPALPDRPRDVALTAAVRATGGGSSRCVTPWGPTPSPPRRPRSPRRASRGPAGTARSWARAVRW